MTHARKRLSTLSATITAVALLAFAPAVLAADPALEAYSPPGGSSQVDVQQADPQAASSSTRSSTRGASQAGATRTESDTRSFLPFTGLDLGFVLMAGGALLALGFGLRRLTRGQQRQLT